MGILIFILVVTLTIALHEYGHYLACRAFKIPVLDFSVGMGKSLFSHRSSSGTVWNVRLIPLGGFVRPSDEMNEASPLAKAIIALAGPLANIFPFIVLALLTGTLMEFFNLFWNLYLLSFVIIGDILMLPFQAMSLIGPASAMTAASDTGVYGPIGIGAESVALTAQNGPLMAFFVLLFALNIGVALFNLLPIPLLDGGRFIMATVEAFAGRAKATKIESVTDGIGVAVIIVIFATVMLSDVLRLI